MTWLIVSLVFFHATVSRATDVKWSLTAVTSHVLWLSSPKVYRDVSQGVANEELGRCSQWGRGYALHWQ